MYDVAEMTPGAGGRHTGTGCSLIKNALGLMARQGLLQRSPPVLPSPTVYSRCAGSSGERFACFQKGMRQQHRAMVRCLKYRPTATDRALLGFRSAERLKVPVNPRSPKSPFGPTEVHIS
jgi:hypothetical protein